VYVANLIHSFITNISIAPFQGDHSGVRSDHGPSTAEKDIL